MRSARGLIQAIIWDNGPYEVDRFVITAITVIVGWHQKTRETGTQGWPGRSIESKARMGWRRRLRTRCSTWL